MKRLQFNLENEQATVEFGNTLARLVTEIPIESMVVFLNGDLGAGKTTLTRGFVQGMGHNGNVKSPTYTLVEPYELEPYRVFHFDLYRLADPEELEYMGIRDYFQPHCFSFIEWPEKGAGILPAEDLIIDLEYVEQQRRVTLVAKSVNGEQIINKLV